MLTHRTATRLPPISVGELQQFISTPDEKQLIDIHAWALTKALSASTDSDSDTSSCSARDVFASNGFASESSGARAARDASDGAASDASNASDSAASDASIASDSYERLRLLVALRDEAGGAVYIADGHSYAKDTLECEFPEFKLFNLHLDEAFTESICPGVWIETPQFAALRSLSAMRREIRRTGLHPGAAAVDIMRALLGL